MIVCYRNGEKLVRREILLARKGREVAQAA